MHNEEAFEVREVFFQDEGGAGECPFVFIAYRAASEPAENDANDARDSLSPIASAR